jgi:putative ABC transport system permease protein
MGFLNKLRNSLLRGEDARVRAEDEARFHVEMRQADLEDRGLSPEDARAQARRAFGNVTSFQENTGDMDVWLALEAFTRDAKIAWRRLRRSPLFLATSIFLLAFGIGVNTAVFSVVDHLFLRPLPFPNADRLVVLQESRKGEISNSNAPRLKDWATRIPAFEAVMGTYGETLPLTTNEGKHGVLTLRTVGAYLPVLGVAPLEGRAFTSEEMRGGQVAYLTQRSKRLGRVGDSLNLAGALYQIVGVVPDIVSLGEEIEVITPAPREVQGASRSAGFLPVIARLKPGQNIAAAASQVTGAAQQLAKEYADTDANLSAYLRPAQDAWNEDAKPSATLLQAACVLLLLITILNVSALFAARAADRQKESAIRSFLGAGTGAILRLHFAEALILTLFGTAAAALVASWALELMQTFFASKFPAIALVTLDARVFAFLAILAVSSSLVFASVMAIQSAYSKRTQNRSKPWLRGSLIAVEAGLGILLASFAIDLAQQFADRRARPLGFAVQNVITASVDLPWSADHDELVTAMNRGLELYTALPGVSSVGVTDRLPLNGGTQSGKILIQGAPVQTGNEIGFRMASASFFTTLKIPLLSGSPLGEKDAVLVNDVFARRYLDNNAVGRYIARAGKNPKYWRVAGVVAGVRADASEAEVRPEVYLDYRQFSWPKLEFVLATSQPPSALAPALRKLSSQLSPNALLDEVSSLDSRLGKLDREPEQKRNVLLLFAVLAIALVCVGVYGVLSAELNRRTRELGIRLAIGASPWEIALLLFRQAIVLAAAALMVGLPIAIWNLAAIPSLFAALVVAIAIAAAAAVPALRSARIQPSVALRAE